MSQAQKTGAQTRLFAEMVAKKQGWAVNADSSFTDLLIDGLTVNWNRYGYYLCPCRDTEGARDADKDVICPCVFSWRDIEEYGHCYCALYLRHDFAIAGKVPSGIPDRRFQGEKTDSSAEPKA